MKINFFPSRVRNQIYLQNKLADIRCVCFGNALEHDVFQKSDKKKDIDYNAIQNLGIKNLRKVSENGVRGQCLEGEQQQPALKELKNAGIDVVIDLRNEKKHSDKYENACKQNDLKYFNLKVQDSEPMFIDVMQIGKKIARKNDYYLDFIQKLSEFFRIMDEENYYIGCLLGLHRTDLAVTMNYLLNPKEIKEPPLLSHNFNKKESNFTNKYIKLCKNVLNNVKRFDKKNELASKGAYNRFNERAERLKEANNGQMF